MVPAESRCHDPQMTESVAPAAEEPAIRRATRALLVGTWATGPLFLIGTAATPWWKLVLASIFLTIQISNISQVSRLRWLRQTSAGWRSSPIRRWREEAVRAEWPPAVTIGLTFASMVMLLTGAAIVLLSDGSS